MAAKVTFNQSFWRKKALLQAAIIKTGNKSVERLAEFGLSLAKGLAPVDSGKTAGAIRRVTKTKDKLKGITIISPNKHRHASTFTSKGGKSTQGEFHLPRWMHTSPDAKNHIKTGDRRYMYTTARILRKIKKGVAQATYKSIRLR